MSTASQWNIKYISNDDETHLLIKKEGNYCSLLFTIIGTLAVFLAGELYYKI